MPSIRTTSLPRRAIFFRARSRRTGQLYIDGYRFIHVIGPLFLLQASAAFAVAALLLLAAPLLLRIAAAALAIGALAGFATSRTIGLFGFSEHGLQPAPRALLSLIAETLTLLTVAAWQESEVLRHRRTQPHRNGTSRMRPGPYITAPDR